MTEVSFRVLKHFFFGRVEKLSVSPAHFTPVSGQLFRFYSADCRSNSSIITFRNQYFNESSIARGFHLGRHLFGFHLIKDVTESKVCAQLYVPASDRAFFHVHAKHRQLKRHLHATSPSLPAPRLAASTIPSSGITSFSRCFSNLFSTSCTLSLLSVPRIDSNPCSSSISAFSLAPLLFSFSSSFFSFLPFFLSFS